MKTLSIDELDFEKGGGLVPVVTQDAGSLEILTLAYVNREALELTQKTGYAHYDRRSYSMVMKKGVTSGNIQKIVEILTDCDQDALVYLVEQTGPACHLGKHSCFHYRVE